NVLHHHEPTLHGRYLLFLASSFGVAGLALIWRGVFLARWGHAEQAGQSSLLGARAFVVTPFLWLVGGLGVYFGRSEDVRDLLTSGAAAPALLLLGAAGGVVASIGTYRSRRRPTARQAVIASVGVLVVTACMVVLRDLARIRELSPHWSLSDVPINAQWGMFGLFVAALLGGVVLLVILARKVFPNMVQASLGAAGRS
ncbi:MAG: hypothetical protein KKB50_21365, partial [Planctomycetes bacterium]|nr:hypothetical protein [Planctomycetota bacterium]